MRNNVKVAPALSPLSAIYSAITDTLIHMPFHGGGAATINFAAALAVVKGYPTKVTLGSAPSPAPLCGSKVKVSGATPTGYNGYWKVLYSNGADVYLDLDSSALGDWASGGAMSFNVIYDRLGNLAEQDLSGTVTGLWADQTNGMVAHSAGTYTARITSGISAFDLSAFSGFLVVGAKLKISSATPSSEEFLFSMGRISATGAYSGSGTIALSISTSGQLTLYFRPRTVAGADAGGAGGGTNSFAFSSALGTTAQRNVVFLLDLRSTSSATCYAYLDGVLKAATALTLTNMLDWPGNTNGIVFGANLNGSLVPAAYLGAATPTASGAVVEDFLWWKTTKSLTTVQRAINRWQRNGELPREVV